MQKNSYILMLLFSVSLFAQKGNGNILELCSPGESEWYIDNDGDGYGGLLIQCSANQPLGYVSNSSDCDDNDPNSTIEQVYYQDHDGDGYGGTILGILSCSQPPDGNGYTYVLLNGDCDDNNPNITNENATTWYADTDGDGLGDPNTTISTCSNSPPQGYVSNNSDQCPNTHGNGAPNGCPVGGGSNENINWVRGISYDVLGNVTSASKSYFDDLGKGIQSQSLDIKTGKTWASQTLYDQQGRPALQTLSAPINTTGQFLYNPYLTKKPNGDTYTSNDFETDPENPSTVGNVANSTGWYYSEDNTSEPYQDVTDYPFSRTIYSELNPGSALKTLGGNKVNINGQDQWINGFSYSMPASQELYYAFGKGYFGENGVAQEEVVTKFYKSVSIDVHGTEVVAFTDGEGKTLASARSGGNTKYEVVSTIGEQNYVDIHVATGILNSDIQFLGNESDYIIYDLRTEQVVTKPQMSSGNFYRIEFVGDITEWKSYINSDGSITTDADAKGVRYKVNYYDYTLNYYDKAGRLIETTQPLGFNEEAFNLTAELPIHDLKSTFSYNTLGQLTETTSPDEGQANFMYREDGQIRFSQNSKQALVGEFSYTNYDDSARPIESGVYEGNLSFSSVNLKEFDIVDNVRIKEEGNRLTKLPHESWNAGLATVKMISANGYAQWQFSSTENRSMVGLSPTNAGYSYNTIKYAIYARGGSIYVYEQGNSKGEFGPFDIDDIFKVERSDNVIYYKKNGVPFYTSSVTSSGNLLGDMSLFNDQDKILNFELGGTVFTPNDDPFINYKNVSVSGNTVAANAGSDSTWDAGINTLQTLNGNGSISWTGSQTNKALMVGLSSYLSVNSGNYAYSDYAIYLNSNGDYYVYERGGYIGNFGSYNTNNVFKIEHVGNLIHYSIDGTVFYTSNKTSTNEDLFGDVSMRDIGASIDNLTLLGGEYKFKHHKNVKTTANEIRKISGYGWSSGFASSTSISGDGYVQFKAGAKTSHMMLGLSETNANYNYNTIGYALYLTRAGAVNVYESGSYKGKKSTYVPGDIFKVERTGASGTIKYYKNNELIYTSSSTSTVPLLIDASFLEAEMYIEDLQFYDLLNPSLNPTVSVDDVLNSNDCKEQHYTIYDIPQTTNLQTALNASSIPFSHYSKQNFVAGNVSSTYTNNPKTNETFYSYDVYGRVEWMVQDVKNLGTKTIDYEYDPVSGLVTKVIYQKHVHSELFTHKYNYNTVNQLTEVSTSTDNTNFTIQAQYFYYETGELKRTVIGGEKVGIQGIDYVYNLSGQLKAINHPSLQASNDPGGDSNDAFGMHIDYYSGDYARTNTPKPIVTSAQGENRYDGNIKATRWATKSLDNDPSEIQNAYTYAYNNSKWLTNATYGSTNNSGTITPNSNQDFRVSNLSYDANGNLLSLSRNKHTENSSNAMDNFSYQYNSLTNQLNHVNDAVTSATNADDLEAQSLDNYEYNAIGQLVKNNQDNIEYIYNASGLVTQIKKDGNVFLNFYYDDRGQRIRKEVTYDNGNIWNETYYVRDASGSVMAIYTGKYGSVKPIITQSELPIYGLSRLGILNKYKKSTKYQLTDHLGNVRAIVSTPNTIDAYTDYYPFGMPMPNRNVEGNYRYGYQGEYAEKEPELGGGQNSFELRLYDSRIGRWLTTDPMYEFSSPYLGMGNNPINKVDPDGGSTEQVGNCCGWLLDLIFGMSDTGEEIDKMNSQGEISNEELKQNKRDRLIRGVNGLVETFKPDGGELNLQVTLPAKYLGYNVYMPEAANITFGGSLYIDSYGDIGVNGNYGWTYDTSPSFSVEADISIIYAKKHGVNLILDDFSGFENNYDLSIPTEFGFNIDGGLFESEKYNGLSLGVSNLSSPSLGYSKTYGSPVFNISAYLRSKGF